MWVWAELLVPGPPCTFCARFFLLRVPWGPCHAGEWRGLLWMLLPALNIMAACFVKDQCTWTCLFSKACEHGLSGGSLLTASNLEGRLGNCDVGPCDYRSQMTTFVYHGFRPDPTTLGGRPGGGVPLWEEAKVFSSALLFLAYSPGDESVTAPYTCHL
jgi:hypothetical protein